MNNVYLLDSPGWVLIVVFVKKFIAFVTFVTVILACISSCFEVCAGDGGIVGSDGSIGDNTARKSYGYDNKSYNAYIAEYEYENIPGDEIFIDGSDYTSEKDSGVAIRGYQGKDSVLFWDSQEGYVEWRINVENAGLYNIGVEYCPIPGRNSDIEMELQIDGEVPFSGAESFTLSRTWRNERNDFLKDSRGNQLRPRQVEVLRWDTVPVRDTNGRYNEPYRFFFSEGEHTLRLGIVNESLAISGIRLYQVQMQESYIKPVVESPVSGFLEIYQAERMHLKSSPTLFPAEDKGNPATQPSHPFLTRYNTVGRNTFLYPGQWISWEFDVPEDGYYNISFKVRQDVQRGMYSTRRIYIDGEVPFSEMNNVRFPYGMNWYTQALGGEEPFLFYLEKGRHELKMEVVTGYISESLGEIEDIVYELNTWYRKIIMITGSNPDSTRQFVDVNRDFLLDQKIPGLMDSFDDVVQRLSRVKKTIDDLSLDDGNTASFIDEISTQLRSFLKEPETIPKRLDNFKSNISTLSTVLLQMREQPLEIDYFAVYSPDCEKALPSSNSGIFSTIVYRFRMFISSFLKDYSTVGEIYEGDSLDVWVSTSDAALTGALAGSSSSFTGISAGRDQALAIKNLVDDLFVPDTGIGVNISLVNSSEALIQAVLAGQGPDAALFIERGTPVNLAMRSALVDLTQYDGFDSVRSRFHESAMIPYYFEGGCYALPETQNFDMMFYRTDVFNELGLDVPRTWEEFYALAAILQINNMTIGMHEDQRIFEMLLYQNNGMFYNERLTATAFDSPAALNAFKQWTGLYAKYGMPLVFDFFSRFRTGEMPVAIMPYTQVNYLIAAAPEIRNLWDIAPVPGVLHEDGSINNAVTSNGTGAIVIKDSGMEDEAYRFIEWWTGSEAQARFGNELEQLMGPASRYPTANREAFEYLPWSHAQSENLITQWEMVTEIPQVPGNYYINRNISFAFRAVVYKYENERETLNKYNRYMNKEIERKRLEFGLDTE